MGAGYVPKLWGIPFTYYQDGSLVILKDSKHNSAAK